MSYSQTAVRFFTTPKPLGDAMDTDPNSKMSGSDAQSQSQSQGQSHGHTVVRPNVSTRRASSEVAEQHKPKSQGLTFANQDSLPKLPIPDLEDTCRRYLDALQALQGPREYEDTKAAVRDFLKEDGPILQEKLKTYAGSKTSYIEQFCEFWFQIDMEQMLIHGRV
jgi:carnitine O-acetyltransferase